MADHGQEAFVTLATNDSYSVGALVLAHSLRWVKTTRRLVVMVTSGVSSSLREQLSSVFDVVTQVDVLDSHDSTNLELLTRPDLGVTFTKLHCWRLTQFTKCVFLDADTLVIRNIDDLFEREEFSAAPDVGWPDCFNSGVFVYRPSNETYAALLHFAVTYGSFDGGDQGLLNLYFSDWATKDITRRLPFIYNVVSQAFYSYLPALKQYGKQTKVLHFIGSVKPWHQKYNSSTGQVDLSGESSHYAEFLQLWWNIFLENVKPNVNFNVVVLTEHLSQLSVFTKQELDDGQRQYNWERGQIDYLGIDSFDNIQKQLDHKLTSPEQLSEPPKIKISSEPEPAKK
jgi:glycogenin glucosyltransferase